MALTARLRPMTDGLRNFLSWWGDELLSLVPRDWWTGLAPVDRRPTLMVNRDRLALVRAEGTGDRKVLWDQSADDKGDFDLAELSDKVGDARVHLQFDKSLVLEKLIPLPPLSASDKEQAIVLQIERQFPYRQSDVYVAFSKKAEIGADGVRRYRVAVAERRDIDPVLQLIRQVGVRAASFSVISRGGPLAIPALHKHQDRQTQKRLTALAAVAVLSLAGFLITWHGHRDGYIGFLEREIAVQRELAMESRVVVDQVAELEAARSWLGGQVARPSLSVLLDSLAGQLPDSAWIDQLEWNTDRLRLRGLANDAVGLSTVLEDHDLFHDVQFSGAVTARGNDGKERFDLTAQTVIR